MPLSLIVKLLWNFSQRPTYHRFNSYLPLGVCTPVGSTAHSTVHMRLQRIVKREREIEKKTCNYTSLWSMDSIEVFVFHFIMLLSFLNIHFSKNASSKTEDNHLSVSSMNEIMKIEREKNGYSHLEFWFGETFHCGSNEWRRKKPTIERFRSTTNETVDVTETMEQKTKERKIDWERERETKSNQNFTTQLNSNQSLVYLGILVYF